MSSHFPSQAPGEVTDVQLRVLESHAAQGIANALSTEPVVAERLVPAVHALYAAAGLKPPRVVIVSSPIVMAFAGGFAAAIWWVRKNDVSAWRQGVAWANGYSMHEATVQSTSPPTHLTGRPTWQEATRRATELATAQPHAQAYAKELRRSLQVPGSGPGLDVVRLATDPASREATEHATRSASSAATSQVTGEPELELIRQAAQRRVPRVRRRTLGETIKEGMEQAAGEALRVAETHEDQKAAMVRRHIQMASLAAIPSGCFDGLACVLDATIGTDNRLKNERDATRLALESASHPPDPSGHFAFLAYDLGAGYGIDYRLLLRCTNKVGRLFQGGNMASTADSRVSALRDAQEGLLLPEHEPYGAWEACAIEGGVRIVHEEFCIVSDRPEMLKVDDENRPHCADGPSHRWRDGWSLYHWHGTRIPPGHEYLILAPEQITVAAIEAEQNTELRRVMIERYGAVRYFVDSGATIVEELPADHRIIGLRSARLLHKGADEGPPGLRFFVDLLNSTPEPDGTVKRYLLRVDPNAYGGDASRHVQAAVASTWRNADGSLAFSRWQEYDPDAES